LSGKAGSPQTAQEKAFPFPYECVAIQEPRNATWVALAAIVDKKAGKPVLLNAPSLDKRSGVIAHGARRLQQSQQLEFVCGTAVRFTAKRKTVHANFIVAFVPAKGAMQAAVVSHDNDVQVVAGHMLEPTKGASRLFMSGEDVNMFVESGVEAIDTWLGRNPGGEAGEPAPTQRGPGEQSNRRGSAPLAEDERKNFEALVKKFKEQLGAAQEEAGKVKGLCKEIETLQKENEDLATENAKLSERVAVLEARLDEKREALDRLGDMVHCLAPEPARRGRSPPPRPRSPAPYHGTPRDCEFYESRERYKRSRSRSREPESSASYRSRRRW
jgi:hypothetical protein